MKISTLHVFMATTSFCFVYALECGINIGSGQNELKKLAASCVNVIPETDKNTTNTTVTNTNVTNTNNESSEDEITAAGSRRSRSATTNDSITAENYKTDNDPSNENNIAAPQKCIVQCIFQKLEMTDDDGYPEHSRVSEGLLRNAYGRELKDFLQDSADACFQIVNVNKSNACQFSIRLITCLADRGKSNCADWPVGELPFQMDINQNQTKK